MGFLDVLLGRSKPVKPDLDRLFALPTAAVTLEAATGFTPTGLGSVCFRAAEGGAFARLQRDVRELLDVGGGPEVELSTDSYGYTWLLSRHAPDDLSGLVTDLHAVNATLESNGFGPHLLCSLASFDPPDPDRHERFPSGGTTPQAPRQEPSRPPSGRSGGRLALVYLYKRGTFYPFAPLTGRAETRDNALELQVRGGLGADLPIEQDLGRWFPVWGAPGV